MVCKKVQITSHNYETIMSEIWQVMHSPGPVMASEAVPSAANPESSEQGVAGLEAANGHAEGAFNFERDIDSFVPVEVTETRLTGRQLSSLGTRSTFCMPCLSVSSSLFRSHDSLVACALSHYPTLPEL